MPLYRAMIRLRITIPLEGNWLAAQEKVRKEAGTYLLCLTQPLTPNYEGHPTIEIPERLYDGYSNPRKGWAPLAAFGGKVECRQKL
jgi:hypothetical protein